jgi:hypothetical protein
MCLAPTTIHSCVFRLSLKVGSIFGAVFETQNASRFATFYRFVTPQTFNIPSQYVTLHVTNDRFGALPPYACALAQTSGVASVIANNRIPHDLISGTFRRLSPDQPVKFPHNLGTAAVSSTPLVQHASICVHAGRVAGQQCCRCGAGRPTGAPSRRRQRR